MRIYFSGIGGVGIGPLAQIAADAGYEVSGSDREASPLTEALTARGALVSLDQSGDFLRQQHQQAPIDWFVYTAALPEDHPERQAAAALGIRTSKRDELLAHIIRDKGLKMIAVAGTHGKTTTTGMLVWTLQRLGLPISYAVGSTLSFAPSGQFDPASEYFIYECDEFDRNFLHFSPWLSLITAIGYDHPDIYPTEADYQAAFRQFITQSDQVVMWQRDAEYIKSCHPHAWQLQDDEVMALALPGAHNRRNATLVMKACERVVGRDNQAVRGWLEQFPGTGRRFEKLADNLYSDYGHHPIEIAATLQMARELSDKVVLVYQPHQNSRQHEVRQDYTNALFQDAAALYWLPTYLTREDPHLPTLTPEELTRSLTPETLHITELGDDLWRAISDARQSGALVLCMGAGSIDTWVRQQLTATA